MILSSPNYPVLQVGKSLKVVDKLLPKPHKLRWNELDVGVRYFIFSELFRYELKQMEYCVEFPIEMDCFFNEFILNEDEILFRYNKFIDDQKELAIDTLQLWEYGEDFFTNDKELLEKYCKHFGFSIYEEAGEYIVSKTWNRIEFDFSIIAANSNCNRLLMSFNNDIEYKNIEFIKNFKFSTVCLRNTESLSESQLEKIFSIILNENLYNVYFYPFHGSQRDYEIHSKFFPFVSSLSITNGYSIKDYRFLLNYSELNNVTARFTLPDDNFKSFIKNISFLKKIKYLHIDVHRRIKEVFLYDILFLSNLKEIEDLVLSNCSNLLELNVLYSMNNLKSLNLYVLGDVKYVKSQLDKLQEYRPKLRIRLISI